MKLTSDRLYFRKLTDQDASETYASWLNDPQINQHLETRHAVQTTESCKHFIDAMNHSQTDYLFGIFLRHSDQHIGNIKLGFIDQRYQTAQLSLLIGEKSTWGHGYATEAIRTLSQFGFHDLGLEKIEAGCYEDNIGSLRAFIKTGYTVEGFLRKNVVSQNERKGCFCLGMLKNEFQYA